MPQSVFSSPTPSSRSRSSSISSACSSSSYSSTLSSNSSYSLSSYGSTRSSFSSYSSHSHTSSSSSVSQQRAEPISTLFYGLNFFFDKNSFKSLNEKQRIMSLVKDHSGSISFMLSKKTTHFIVDHPTTHLLALEGGGNREGENTFHKTISHSLIYQLNSAVKLNIPVASFDFLFTSITQLTLAHQHVVTFTREVRVLAPEAPMLIYESLNVTEQETVVVEEQEIFEGPQLDMSVTGIEAEILEGEKEEEDEKKEERKSMETMALVPTILPLGPPNAFSPTTFQEKDRTYAIMSRIDIQNENQADQLEYSFEESRFYKHYLPTGDCPCLDMPTIPEAKKGSLWYWGNNSKGQLGSGGTQRHWIPTFQTEEFGEPLAQVACGDFHTAVVSSSGNVWTWGSGKRGCLGNGKSKISVSPVLVDAFVDIKINMIACGKSHTAALSSVGTVWTWGSNNDMQLGYETQNSSLVPQEVHTLKESIFVACGGNNTAVITRFGHLYTMGCDKFGQRGIGRPNKNKKPPPAPSLVEFPDKAKVKYVNIGQGFMGALGMRGELYMWGYNAHSQCANGRVQDVTTPQEIAASSEVIHISCGDTHAAYVNAMGEVYTWGWGPVGQLGHAAPLTNCEIPTAVKSVTGVAMVACGARHTVALSPTHGKIWVWGANEMGQLGLPTYGGYYDSEDEYEEYEDEDEYEDEETDGESITWISPQIVESLSMVSTIACGREHTMVIVEDAYVPIQFAKDGDDEAMAFWLENDPKMRDLDKDAVKVALTNIRDDELGTDYSLLHWATYFANEEILELLVDEKWMDPNITDCRGDTPLHVCAKRDIPFCVQILLENGAKPDLKNKEGKTAIHISVENHTIDVLREIVENSVSDKSVVDEVGNTPLHYAIQLRHFDMAKYLIERAAQPQILDKSGKTALDYCSSMKETSYFKSIALQNDVFISYAHVDLTFALKIKEFLESFAIKCWMDMTRLEAGSDWRLDIGNGLLNSRLVLYVGSRASVVSDWCIKELHMARRHNRTIIPIWYQKVEFDSEVKSLIFGRGFLDFSDPRRFNKPGRRLAKKLKYALTIIKQARPNPYLEIPALTTEELWKQLFLTILIESHTNHEAAYSLEQVLHNQAIFSCTHNFKLSNESPYAKQRDANVERAWGIIFLLTDLKQAREEVEKWWKYAEDKGKKVYICMARGDATSVKTEDLPTQALAQASIPIFYLESMASLQQLIFFVYLAQREQFMAKQVGVMQDKLTDTITNLKENEQEMINLKKRFYVNEDETQKKI